MAAHSHELVDEMMIMMREMCIVAPRNDGLLLLRWIKKCESIVHCKVNGGFHLKNNKELSSCEIKKIKDFSPPISIIDEIYILAVTFNYFTPSRVQQ